MYMTYTVFGGTLSLTQSINQSCLQTRVVCELFMSESRCSVTERVHRVVDVDCRRCCGR